MMRRFFILTSVLCSLTSAWSAAVTNMIFSTDLLTATPCTGVVVRIEPLERQVNNGRGQTLRPLVFTNDYQGNYTIPLIWPGNYRTIVEHPEIDTPWTNSIPETNGVGLYWFDYVADGGISNRFVTSYTRTQADGRFALKWSVASNGVVLTTSPTQLNLVGFAGLITNANGKVSIGAPTNSGGSGAAETNFTRASGVLKPTIGTDILSSPTNRLGDVTATNKVDVGKRGAYTDTALVTLGTNGAPGVYLRFFPRAADGAATPFNMFLDASGDNTNSVFMMGHNIVPGGQLGTNSKAGIGFGIEPDWWSVGSHFGEIHAYWIETNGVQQRPWSWRMNYDTVNRDWQNLIHLTEQHYYEHTNTVSFLDITPTQIIFQPSVRGFTNGIVFTTDSGTFQISKYGSGSAYLQFGGWTAVQPPGGNLASATWDLTANIAFANGKKGLWQRTDGANGVRIMGTEGVTLQATNYLLFTPTDADDGADVGLRRVNTNLLSVTAGPRSTRGSLEASNIFAEGVIIPATVGAGKLLRTDANTNLAAVTIGSGIGWDGTTITGTGGAGATNAVSTINTNGVAAGTGITTLGASNTPSINWNAHSNASGTVTMTADVASGVTNGMNDRIAARETADATLTNAVNNLSNFTQNVSNDLYLVRGMTNSFVTLATAQTITGAKTIGTLNVDTQLVTHGQIVRVPQKSGNATITVTGTNFLTIATNASFTLTFSGQTTNGQLVSLMVSNYAIATDILMTNATSIWDFDSRSNVTAFSISSNSIATFHFRYLTNFEGGGRWYCEQRSGFAYALAPGSFMTWSTNTTPDTITVNVTGVQPTNAVLTHLGNTGAVTNENSPALQINSGVLSITPGNASNLVSSTIDFPGGANVISNLSGTMSAIVTPAITESNLLVTPGRTNVIECVGLTNIVITNIVELPTGVNGKTRIAIRNTLGSSIPIVWPAFGAQHGYYFHTNGYNDVLSVTSAPPGTNTMVDVEADGTNMYPAVTQWRHP